MRAIVKRRLHKTRKPNTLHISDVSDDSRVGVFNQRDCEVIDDDSLSTNSSRDGDSNYCVVSCVAINKRMVMTTHGFYYFGLRY